MGKPQSWLNYNRLEILNEQIVYFKSYKTHFALNIPLNFKIGSFTMSSPSIQFALLNEYYKQNLV